MAFLQNSRRLSSPNKNFISSTLIDNSSTSIPRIVTPNPRISVSAMPRTGSGVSGSVSSLDLSPISPVFLNNDTFSLENSPIERDNFSKKYKTPILSGSMNVPRRIKSNENFNCKSPNENSKYNTRRVSTAFENTSGFVTNTTFTIEKSPTGCNLISKKFVSPNSGKLGSTTATQKNKINQFSPIENLQRTTSNLSSGEKSKRQIFFPPDFEISNRSASNNSLKRLSPIENLQRTSPNLSLAGNRSGHRLSPMMMDKKTNFVPVKCSTKPISQKNTCTKTVIAQKQQTTTTNYNGNIYQQVTKTYVVQQTIKSPFSINQDDNKMVNTNSNLQLNRLVTIFFKL